MTVVPFVANFNSGDASEFIATGGGGSIDSNGWGVLSYVTSNPTPYSGSTCAGSTVRAGSTTGFARWNCNSMNFVEGDEFYLGYALFIKAGFYPTAQTSSTRLCTVDNFNVTANEDRLGLWIYSDDSVRVLKHKEGTGESTLINLGAGTSVLPEGQWHYIEQHFKMHHTDGSAISRIWINGVLKGSSTLANLQPNFESPFQRFRVGICDISWVRAADVTMYFDDAYIGPTKRGGTGSPDPSSLTLSDLANKVSTLEARMAAVEASAARSDRKLEAVEAVDLGSYPSFKKQGNALKGL